MSNRVLFVDDEVSLLNGIKRRLGTELDLVAANSGKEALAALETQGPFAVAVTDMRMPNMDGIQFIKAAREKWPNTVYIMLTGNQDQATAIQALNEGHVFRFLTKPCQSTEIQQAVEAALRQYQLVTAEKELLQNTFVGAVSVLTDVLELAHPSIFGSADRTQQLIRELEESLRLEDHWEYKMAARLGLLGFALLPEHERMQFEMGIGSGEQFNATVCAAATIGKRIIERIPRLGNVARLIGMIGSVDGCMYLAKGKSDAERIVTRATLLRIAIHWDFLIRQGMSPRAAAEEICASLPALPPIVANVLADQVIENVNTSGIDCEVSKLVEGMVLQEDVLTCDGTILLRSGRRLTWTIIEKLSHHKSSPSGLRTVRVCTASASAVKPDFELAAV